MTGWRAKLVKFQPARSLFSYGDEIVAHKLTAPQVQGPGVRTLAAESSQSAPRDVEVGNENFVATSLDLTDQREIPFASRYWDRTIRLRSFSVT